MSCHSLLSCRISAESSAVNLIGIPLYVICCFSPAAFNIFSLYLIFDSLNDMSWPVSPWIYSLWDSVHFLDLTDYFLSHVREVFNYNLFKYFLNTFFFSSSSGTPIIQMFVPLILPLWSLRLFSIFSFFCL